MKHRTQTVVKHWIDLDESEQFDVSEGGFTRRVVRLLVEIFDGSDIRFSGYLGNLSWTHWLSSATKAEHIYPILRAHGIETPEPCPYTFAHTRQWCGHAGCRAS
jgi:hypothetical protein